MTSIKLLPENGGEAIDVTDASTVIGRGAFLKVIDKRVSRSHALLEVIDRKLHLTPTHTNPCFYRRGGKGTQQVLKREVRQPLDEGDMFGLLPDQLFYTITYGDASLNGVKTNGERKEPVKKEPVQPSPKKGGKARKPVRKEESEEEDEEPRHQGKAIFRDVIVADGKNMALPLTKTRKLPAWMIRLSNTSAPPVKRKAAPVKKAAPAKRAAPSRPVSKKKNENFFDDEEEEEDERPPKKRSRKPKPDDDYEEESEEEAPRKRGGKAKRNQRQSDDASDSEEDRPKRRKAAAKQQRRGGRDLDEPSGRLPRRAATKSIGSYEEDFKSLEFDESDDAPAKGDSDSDFKMEDDGDSGSDWDKRRGSTKKPARKPAGRTPARGGRNKRRKARRGSDSEEDDFEESEDEYVPRPSKRRGGGGGASQRRRKPADSEEEEEEEEEEVKVPKKTKRGLPAKSPSKKERSQCYYGSKCYRRNPDHFKQFSHPEDSDYKEEELEESDNEKRPGKGRKRDDNPTRKAETVKAPAKKKKKTKSDEEEDDDGLPNTYDYNDSFIDDAGISSQSQGLSQTQRTEEEDESEEEAEDITELNKEAKSFIRNKKMMMPVSDDV